MRLPQSNPMTTRSSRIRVAQCHDVRSSFETAGPLFRRPTSPYGPVMQLLLTTLLLRHDIATTHDFWVGLSRALHPCAGANSVSVLRTHSSVSPPR